MDTNNTTGQPNFSGPQPPAGPGPILSGSPAPVPQQPGTAGAPQPSNGMAVAALILGILGFIWIVPFIGSILGIIFGIIALKQIKQGKGTGKGMALTGLWLGVAGLVITALLTALLITATRSGIQDRARDVTLKTTALYLQSNIETYHAENQGIYPSSLIQLESSNSSGGYTEPDDISKYEYTALPAGCSGDVASVGTDTCTGYTLTVKLSSGENYTLRSSDSTELTPDSTLPTAEG